MFAVIPIKDGWGRHAIGASETGRSLLEANRPLAGCLPAEPASVSSGNIISTRDGRERNHWTTQYALKKSIVASESIGHLCQAVIANTFSGIATFQSRSTAPGILCHSLTGTDS